MAAADCRAAAELARRVFWEFVAPGCTALGVKTFEEHASPQAVRERLDAGNIFLVAETGGRIEGVLELKRLGHVSMLFVDGERHRRGLGRALWKEGLAALEKLEGPVEEVTVNASLFAVRAYERLGFVRTGGEELRKGMRFVPMIHLNATLVHSGGPA